MKIPYFCCIGAELKRYMKDFDFMNQVYLYKVPTDDTIDEVLAQDYFKAVSDSVLQDDIIYIYEASENILHECRFDKQNGHITAVPLASDETITGAATSIIHDNLTPDKILISDQDGKVAAGDLSLEYIKDTLSILHSTATLSNTIDTTTVVMLGELESFANIDSRPSYKAPGALVIDNDGNRGIIETIDSDNETATVVTTYVTVVDNFTGATASEDGVAGLVPAPSAGDQDKFLGGDGNWKTINLDVFVNKDGTSIMTGPLKMRSGSMQGAIAPYWNGIGLFKLESNNNVTLLASMEDTYGFLPATTNTYDLGSSTYKWKDLYLEGKAYVATINNGDDLIVPANKSGTLATTADVNAAAVPVGAIVSFAAVPTGWLACDGSEVSRTDYADLFAVIGTTFGAGDGNSTFNLPSSNERFVVAQQDPTAANNYTWYRLYNDGFVEQGGQTYKSGGGTVSVVLPIEMSDANYVVLRNQKGNSFQSYYPTWVAGLTPTQTQTGFEFYSASTTGYDYWEASGMSASVPTYNKIQCIRY